MIAVACLLLAEFVRSRRFVAPLAALLVVVVGLYASAPNPVLETAGSVAAYTVPVQVWLALAFFNTAGAASRQLLAATVGSRAYVSGRLLAGATVAIAGTAVATGYPLLARRFEHLPHPEELAWSAVATLAAGLAGAALAALFAEPLVRSRAVAVLGLAVCVLLTIPLELPPSLPTARALDTQHVSEVPSRLAGDLIAIGAFTAAASVVCARLWPRSE